MPGFGTGRDQIRGRTTASLPSLPGSPMPYRGNHDLAEELAGLAASLHEVDPRSAERMDELAQVVASRDGASAWADVDLRRAFNTERLAQAYAVRHEGGYASRAVDWADRVRNVLVLIPIFLTWFALAEASKAYAAYIAKNPDQVRAPFLLLWQRGFGGEASAFAPTFSTVGLVDAVVIFAIIALTIYAHGRREAREDAISATAGEFQTDLDNALAETTVALASSRVNRPAVLAESVERLAERFDHTSQELLTRLRVEHDRLAAVANRREKEFQDLNVFASGLRAGADKMQMLIMELSRVSNGLQSALEDLTSEVGASGDQQRNLLNAIHNLASVVATGGQQEQVVLRQLSDAATNLTSFSDNAMAQIKAAEQASAAAQMVATGIEDIGNKLRDGYERLAGAMAGGTEANARLAEALRTGTNGVEASAQTMKNIVGHLTQLRQEFALVNQQTANQGAALSQLIGEQRSVASDLSKAARELSAAIASTAHRNQDASVLLSRLDALASRLDRAAAALPSPDALQQAFGAALRTELTNQAGLIANALDGRDPHQPRAAANLWPRAGERRP